MKEESTERGRRLVTRNNWIVCSLLAFVMALEGAGRQHYSIVNNPAYFVGSFIGTLIFIIVLLVIIRGLYRLFTKKRSSTTPA